MAAMVAVSNEGGLMTYTETALLIGAAAQFLIAIANIIIAIWPPH